MQNHSCKGFCEAFFFFLSFPASPNGRRTERRVRTPIGAPTAPPGLHRCIPSAPTSLPGTPELPPSLNPGLGSCLLPGEAFLRSAYEAVPPCSSFSYPALVTSRILTTHYLKLKPTYLFFFSPHQRVSPCEPVPLLFFLTHSTFTLCFPVNLC